MDWLLNLFQSIKTKISQWTSSDTPDVKSKQKVKQPLFNNDKKKTTEPNEISMMTEISDEQIQTNNLRSKYITTVKNPDHRVKKNENPEVIAKNTELLPVHFLRQIIWTNNPLRRYRSDRC